MDATFMAFKASFIRLVKSSREMASRLTCANMAYMLVKSSSFQASMKTCIELSTLGAGVTPTCGGRLVAVGPPVVGEQETNKMVVSKRLIKIVLFIQTLSIPSAAVCHRSVPGH